MGMSVTRRRAMAALVVAGVLVAGLAWPGAALGMQGAAQEGARTFVGRVAGAEGLDALVAVVVGADGNAVVYTCSKDDAWNQANSKWFTGQVGADGRLAAKAADGTEVAATMAGGRLEGTLGTLRFVAEQVSGGSAGLYRGRAGDDVHAVIEAPDGTRVGRVWSVVTGAHVGTWDFNTAQVQWQPGVLAVERAQPERFFIELQVCTNAFC
ncbi:MAG TPA: hypothetical protein VFE37_02215 [Chloroflexota bacterium]|nr:hypothetical protein [Chloroflexota bacterium]